jgi:hypothetical protein
MPAGRELEHQPLEASTPPLPAWDPTRPSSAAPIRADGTLNWQGRPPTESARAAWATGAQRGQRCPDCTAPLTWRRGGLLCLGCRRSTKPLAWRRRVVQLWLNGVEVSAIGEAVGCSKNAIVSFRRRMELPPRGSPICAVPTTERKKRLPGASPDRIIRPKKCKPLPVATAPKQPKRAAALGQPAAPGGAASTAESTRRPKGVHGIVLHRPGYVTCQYVTGRRTFCDDPVQEMSPYCPEHTAACFLGLAA